MKTPVALIIFNRPSHTQHVFEEIRGYKPSRLLVVADGPRCEQEAERCAAARAVIEQIDWKCDVLTNYSDVNLGCNHRIISGLTWVFDQCEEAIILEDDCLLHPSFFRYCSELLEKYRHDTRIMTINGSSFQFGRKPTHWSYHFSLYPHVWGWATWRRAWQYCNDAVKVWPILRNTSWLRDTLADRDAEAYWRMVFEEMCAGNMTWDYQWTFACWTQRGLAIAPNVNLISNIGFGEGATHATTVTHRCASLPTTGMSFPLRHPPYVVRDREADRFEFRQEVPADVYHRLRRRLGVAMPIWVRHFVIDTERRLRTRLQG